MILEYNPEMDFDADQAVTGTGIFGAGVATTLTAPTAGWTAMLISIRSTVVPPVAIGRFVATDTSKTTHVAAMRWTYWYGLSLIVRCNPLAVASFAVASNLGYDVAATMLRYDQVIAFNNF